MVAAAVIQSFITQSRSSSFLIEMPRYQLPRLSDIAARLVATRLDFPETCRHNYLCLDHHPLGAAQFPKGTGRVARQSQVEYSIAGRIADGIEVVVRPIGFNHDIALALIPAMAAREVAVSALATAYAIDATDEEAEASTLGMKLAGKWSLGNGPRLPRVVRFRAAMYFHHCRCPPRNQWLEMADLHGHLSCLRWLMGGGYNLLDSPRPSAYSDT